MAAKSTTKATTAGIAVQATPATLTSITIDAAATAVVTIYDNASAASGTIVFQKSFAAATIYSLAATGGIRLINGAFVVVATAAAQVTLNVN